MKDSIEPFRGFLKNQHNFFYSQVCSDALTVCGVFILRDIDF
jgi:hypothetical protein